MRLEHAGRIQSASLISAVEDETVAEDWAKYQEDFGRNYTVG